MCGDVRHIRCDFGICARNAQNVALIQRCHSRGSDSRERPGGPENYRCIGSSVIDALASIGRQDSWLERFPLAPCLNPQRQAGSAAGEVRLALDCSAPLPCAERIKAEQAAIHVAADGGMERVSGID